MDDLSGDKVFKILDEITDFCGAECNSNLCCPEDECILYRIEQIIIKPDEGA